MKPGYHSTQSKIYNKIPRSEFYGFVLGYAIGTILRGVSMMLFDVDNSYLPLPLAAIGLGIGIWVDRKYYMVKDEPENGDLPEGEESAQDGQAGTGESVQDMQPSGRDDGAGDEAGSMQQRLKKMFEKHEEDVETLDEIAGAGPDDGP